MALGFSHRPDTHALMFARRYGDIPTARAIRKTRNKLSFFIASFLYSDEFPCCLPIENSSFSVARLELMTYQFVNAKGSGAPGRSRFSNRDPFRPSSQFHSREQ